MVAVVVVMVVVLVAAVDVVVAFRRTFWDSLGLPWGPPWSSLELPWRVPHGPWGSLERLTKTRAPDQDKGA